MSKYFNIDRHTPIEGATGYIGDDFGRVYAEMLECWAELLHDSTYFDNCEHDNDGEYAHDTVFEHVSNMRHAFLGVLDHLSVAAVNGRHYELAFNELKRKYEELRDEKEAAK